MAFKKKNIADKHKTCHNYDHHCDCELRKFEMKVRSRYRTTIEFVYHSYRTT